MRKMLIRLCFLLPACHGVGVYAQTTISDTRSAKACYEAKDLKCLEAQVATFSVVGKEAKADSYDVYFYLADLMLEKGGDPIEAKRNLMIAVAFANGHSKAKASLIELYNSGAVTFDSVDCITIESQECLSNLADNENDKDAQYIKAGLLLKEDKEAGLEYLQKAAAQGHKSAVCELAVGVKNGDYKTGQSYHDAVQTIIDDCRFTPAFKKFSPKYFEQYAEAMGHKAYAHSDSGRAYYHYGYISADVAARVALEGCLITLKEGETTCRIINVDDKWVKNFTPPELEYDRKDVDRLLTKAALKSYTDKYQPSVATKVFVQSDAGTWHWSVSDTNPVEVVTKKALSGCNSRNRILKEKFKCRVINVNGEWQ